MISVEHLHSLLASDERDAQLVIVEGHPAIVAGAGPEGPGGGGLAVISRAELIGMAHDVGDERELERIAAGLDTAATEAGG